MKKIPQSSAHAVVQACDVAEARFFFCRVNIEVDEIAFHRDEEGGCGIGAVRKITLTAVLDRLYERILGNPSAVYEDVYVFFICARYARFSDDAGKTPVGIFSARRA